jgi:hypothetical protein
VRLIQQWFGCHAAVAGRAVSNDGPSVFDIDVGAQGKEWGHCGPMGSEFTNLLAEQLVFLGGPGGYIQIWGEVVLPSLAALAAVPCSHVIGNLLPVLVAQLGNKAHK